MRCEIRDGSVTWRYDVHGDELGHFAGAAADDAPDQVPAELAERATATARVRCASPLAQPAAPVRRAAPGECTVELYGLGTVTVGDTEVS